MRAATHPLLSLTPARSVSSRIWLWRLLWPDESRNLATWRVIPHRMLLGLFRRCKTTASSPALPPRDLSRPVSSAVDPPPPRTLSRRMFVIFFGVALRLPRVLLGPSRWFALEESHTTHTSVYQSPATSTVLASVSAALLKQLNHTTSPPSTLPSTSADLACGRLSSTKSLITQLLGTTLSTNMISVDHGQNHYSTTL